MKKKFECSICGKEITKRSKSGMCITCFNKSRSGEKGSGWIDGRTKGKHYCRVPNCNNEICYDNWKYGKGRCRSCAAKEKLKDPRNHPNYNPNKVIKKYFCKICNKPITGRGKTGLCRSCAITERYKDPRNNVNYKHGEFLKDHYCIDCETKISYESWNSGSGRCIKCCCKGERGHNFGKKFSEETKSKMSLANGGTGIPYENSEYPAEFDEILKNDIRMRDKYICQKCGITEKEHRIKYKKALSVHHIDFNRQNCKKENLITVCGSCNTKVNTNKEFWKKYFKEIILNFYILLGE